MTPFIRVHEHQCLFYFDMLDADDVVDGYHEHLFTSPKGYTSVKRAEAAGERAVKDFLQSSESRRRKLCGYTAGNL